MTGEISEMQFAQDQQQRQIENDPNTYVAEDMKQERVTNILQQINPDNLLSDIEHRIRGEKKDYNGTWISISQVKKKVSEEMIEEFISYLGSILNQNTSMSNFTPHEINNLMELIRNWVADHLEINASRYGIEGEYSEYNRIAHIICSPCFTVFKRSQGGKESLRIFKILKLSESNNGGKKKGGFADNFKFW